MAHIRLKCAGIHGQQLRLGIHCLKNQLPLSDNVVRHDEHILSGQPHLPHLHRCGNHDICLSRADIECEQRVFLVDYSLNGVLLIRIEFDFFAHLREGQIGAVIALYAESAEYFVVALLNIPAPVLVFPKPFSEQFENLVPLFENQNRLFLCIAANLAHVEHRLKDIQRIVLRYPVFKINPREAAVIPLIRDEPIARIRFIVDKIVILPSFGLPDFIPVYQIKNKLIDYSPVHPRDSGGRFYIFIFNSMFNRAYSFSPRLFVFVDLCLFQLSRLCIELNPMVEGELLQILLRESVYHLRQRHFAVDAAIFCFAAYRRVAYTQSVIISVEQLIYHALMDFFCSSLLSCVWAR